MNHTPRHLKSAVAFLLTYRLFNDIINSATEHYTDDLHCMDLTKNIYCGKEER